MTRCDRIRKDEKRYYTKHRDTTLLSFYTEMNVLESAWLKKLTHNLNIQLHFQFNSIQGTSFVLREQFKTGGVIAHTHTNRSDGMK